MKTPAFQKVSSINPAFLVPSTCSVSLLSHPSRQEGTGRFGCSADLKKKQKLLKFIWLCRVLSFGTQDLQYLLYNGNS